MWWGWWGWGGSILQAGSTCCDHFKTVSPKRDQLLLADARNCSTLFSWWVLSMRGQWSSHFNFNVPWVSVYLTVTCCLHFWQNVPPTPPFFCLFFFSTPPPPHTHTHTPCYCGNTGGGTDHEIKISTKSCRSNLGLNPKPSNHKSSRCITEQITPKPTLLKWSHSSNLHVVQMIKG